MKICKLDIYLLSLYEQENHFSYLRRKRWIKKNPKFLQQMRILKDRRMQGPQIVNAQIKTWQVHAIQHLT